MTTIYYWPDGSWCYRDDLEEHLYNGIGDDYGVIDFVEEESIDEDSIDAHVRYALGDFKAFDKPQT